MKIGSIKPHIVSLNEFYREEAPTLQIPTIQRQFVWDAEDIKDLIDSIINGYPIGAIIIWEPTTSFPSAPLMGKGSDKKSRRYILDGQQRLTALMLVMNGWKIKRGDKTIQISRISYVPETNRLYLSERKGIDVSLIVNASIGDVDSLLKLQKEYRPTFRKAMQSVGGKIVNYQLPMYVLKTDAGDDEDAYQKIAEIFTRVNSAGVKIGNLEMFLSFFAAAFPRKEKDRIIEMHEAFSNSFELDLEPLVRFVFSRMGMNQNSITKVTSFQRSIKTLKEHYSKDVRKIADTLTQSQSAVQVVLDMLRSELGISSTQFVPSQNILLPLFDYAFKKNFSDHKQITQRNRSKMLFWFLVVSFNGAYSSGPNRKIEEDFDLISKASSSFPLKDLLEALRNRSPWVNAIGRGSIVDVYSNVLRGRSGKEQLMLMAVLLFRNRATDWAGKLVECDKLAIHHLFPRELLKENGENRDEMINCLANLTFIDPSINSEIGDTAPSDYLPDYINKDKDIFQEHMIPTERKLWKTDNFERFLKARAKLIWQKTDELMVRLQG